MHYYSTSHQGNHSHAGLFETFYRCVHIYRTRFVASVSGSMELAGARSSGKYAHILRVRGDGTCWAVGNSGTIIHSFDAGITWLPEMYGLTDNLLRVAIINAHLHAPWAIMACV